MKTGLYIHVPFCIRKCPYCDFYSVPSVCSDVFADYTEAAVRNISHYTAAYPETEFDTVYFGGGTPSLMPPDFFEKVLVTAGSHISSGAEITMELNPKTADKAKLAEIRRIGVNRLSVGIQSAADDELRNLGRIHDFEEAKRAVSDASDAGFDNISGDLMIGIKGQTEGSLVYSVNALSDLELKHISSYMLKIEPGTEYYRSGISSEVPDEDKTADLYLLSVKKLADRGYEQYEISNFSKPGFQSRHNLKYWNCEEYIGIGPSAHSYFNGKRYEVPRDLKDFLSSDHQTMVINESEPGSFFERAMLALRLTKGLDLSLFPEEAPAVLKAAAKFRNTGLIVLNDSMLSFTPEGFLVSNELITELLADI